MRSHRVTVSWNCSSRSRPSRICSRLTRAGNRTAVLIELRTIERLFGMSRPPDSLVDTRFRQTCRLSVSWWLNALVVPGVLLMACAQRGPMDVGSRADYADEGSTLTTSYEGQTPKIEMEKR